MSHQKKKKENLPKNTGEKPKERTKVKEESTEEGKKRKGMIGKKNEEKEKPHLPRVKTKTHRRRKTRSTEAKKKKRAHRHRQKQAE